MPNKYKTALCKGKCGRATECRSNRTGFCTHCRVRPRGVTAPSHRAQEVAAAASLISGRPVSETDRLRVDNATLAGEVRRLRETIIRARDQQVVEDRIVDRIHAAVAEHPYRPTAIPKPQRVGKGAKASPHEMLLLLSDAHYPEVVDPAESLGLCYNPDIARARIAHTFDTVRRYRELRGSAYDVRKLTVAINGDMLSGDIHEELSETNALPMTEALTTLAYLTYDLLRGSLEGFQQVEAVIMPGNHPRLHKKPRAKQKWNNWEYVYGQLIKALAVKEPRLTITVPKAIVYRHQIFDYTVGISHGDGVKAQSFAGIPHYSMARRQNAIQALLKDLGEKQLDLLVYGHFHQLIYDEGQGCSLIINGSVKGGDEYGISSRYSAPRPVQALVTWHPRHGITDLSRINLDHIGAERAPGSKAA